MIKNLSLLKSRQLYWLLLLPLPFSLFAESADSASESDVWELWAKPRICVSSEERLSCEMETDIVWLGEQEADICLSSSIDTDVLQCWVSSSGGEVIQEIDSRKKITYWLTRHGSSQALAKITIRIVKIPQKKVRRRRRHVWSLL